MRHNLSQFSQRLNLSDKVEHSSRGLMEIEHLIRSTERAVGLMEIENLFRYPALAVGLMKIEK